MKGKHAQKNSGTVGSMAPTPLSLKTRGGGGGGWGVLHTRTGPGHPAGECRGLDPFCAVTLCFTGRRRKPKVCARVALEHEEREGLPLCVCARACACVCVCKTLVVENHQ